MAVVDVIIGLSGLPGFAAPRRVGITQSAFTVIDGGSANPPSAQHHYLFGGNGLVGALCQEVLVQ